jgi:uncharacterized protein with GYD domain
MLTYIVSRYECFGFAGIQSCTARLIAPALTAALGPRTVSRNDGGTAMPHYVTLVRYTHQGISKIKDSPSRLDAARKAAEAEGGKIQAWYLTMGHYDAVFIAEFPSDEACAKFTLSAGALGNISTETMKAFPEAEYRKIIGALR